MIRSPLVSRLPRRGLAAVLGVTVSLLAGLAVPPAGAAHVAGAVGGGKRPVRPEVHTLRLSGVEPAARSSALTPLRATEPFRLLGVSWAVTATAAPARIEVRTRGDAGWSPWRDLEVETGGGDPGRTPAGPAGGARASTEPLYTGPATGVQVRVDTAAGQLPPDLRVHLVDPGTSPADAAVGPLADLARPAIMTRAQWGADESLRGPFPGYATTIKAAFVHHTAGTSSYTPAEVPAIIRGIYAYHTETNGWSDIGYNFVVDRFGRIWEGRWGGVDKPVIGAHTRGFNTASFGVGVLGNHETDQVPDPVVAAFGRIIGWKLRRYDRDPEGHVTLISGGGSGNRYPEGQAVQLDVVSGHRDVTRTLCPGRFLYPLLPRIRSEAATYMGG